MTMTAMLGPHLPFLRRYARALTGSQTSGDAYVRASLEALLEGDAELTQGLAPRIALYRLFHALWSSTNSETFAAHHPRGMSPVERRLQALQPTNREALLLTAVEGFSVEETATILGQSTSDVEEAIASAHRAIERDLESRVLIVEDESIIALDIENLVTGLGHRVVGIATTQDEALRMAKEFKPELILTDIQLADGSSGVDAALEILEELDVPIIFITAYPERLLTGDRPEPIYLINKPFSRDTVRATIGQALFFHKDTVPA